MAAAPPHTHGACHAPTRAHHPVAGFRTGSSGLWQTWDVTGGARTLAAMLLAALSLALAAPARAMIACSIHSAAGPNFGRYHLLSSAPNDSAGLLEFRCDGVEPGDAIRIELDRGNSNSFQRFMRQNRSRIRYNLYLDAARTRIWGDGTRGTGVYQMRPPDGIAVSLPIYGRIPPRQNVQPGPYTDHVVLTILY